MAICLQIFANYLLSGKLASMSNVWLHCKGFATATISVMVIA